MTDSGPNAVWPMLPRLIEELCCDSRDIVWFWTPASPRLHFSHNLPPFPEFAATAIERPADLARFIYPADRAGWTAACAQMTAGQSPSAQIELRMLDAGGDVRWARLSMRRPMGDRLPAAVIVGTIADIDDERRMRHLIREKTFQDALTGLPNRILLDYKLQAYMLSADRNNRLLAFILVDINDFKAINDRYRYERGDHVLQVTAARLTACLPADAAIFRVDGDEFAILVKNMDSRTDVEQILHHILRSLTFTLEIDDDAVGVSVSAGVAVYPEDARQADTLKSCAAIALRQAKATGSNGWCCFRPALQKEQERQYGLERHLRAALERRELHVVYQPQVDAADGRITALEALLRWTSGEHGPVSPIDFIPIAEATGLIVPIGMWVLETVCRQLREWLDRGIPAVPVAVNISPVQMRDPQFLPMLRRILAINRLDPGMLELEITESVFLNPDERANSLLADIRAFGIRVTLDDFGSGYSSLTYIRSIALDRLKIDRSFIKEMHARPADRAIIATIIALAHILSLETVAEGVETEAQYEHLKRIGCKAVQGYLFSKPVPASQAADLLTVDRLPLQVRGEAS